MNCTFCLQAIQPGDVNMHHPVPRSAGGIEVEPTHKACHVAYHSRAGGFREWGRLGGLITAATKRWSLNLKHVRSHPGHEINRQFYAAFYGH